MLPGAEGTAELGEVRVPRRSRTVSSCVLTRESDVEDLLGLSLLTNRLIGRQQLDPANLTDPIDAVTGVTRAVTTLLDDLPEENRCSVNKPSGGASAPGLRRSTRGSARPGSRP